MKRIVLIIFSILLCNTLLFAQIENVPNINRFFNLNEAMLSPEKVISLDLSNQSIILNDVDWEIFTNLEYLSLKNDNLNTIPDGITKLNKLRILDLSGNNFKTLPKTMKDLSKLEVLFLNDERQFDLENSINVLSDLPNLKELHLENDNLKTLPNRFNKLKQLESLYLKNNQFIELPKQVMTLEHLQYLDLRKNNIDTNLQDLQNLNFGFKIDLK